MQPKNNCSGPLQPHPPPIWPAAPRTLLQVRLHISILPNKYFPWALQTLNTLWSSLCWKGKQYLDATLYIYFLFLTYYCVILNVLVFYCPVRWCWLTTSNLIAPAIAIKTSKTGIEKPCTDFERLVLGVTYGQNVSDIGCDLERRTLMMHLCVLIRVDWSVNMKRYTYQRA